MRSRNSRGRSTSPGWTDSRPWASILRGLAWFGSYRASFWILAAWFLMLAVWVVPFQATGQPADTLARIGWQWAPMRIMYVVLALATVICTWSRVKRDLRRTLADRMPQEPPARAEHIEALSLKELGGRLEQGGFDVRVSEGRLQAVKNRWSPLGGSVFHLGIIVLGSAIALHLATADAATFRVVEGQSVAETMSPSQEDLWAQRLVVGDIVRSVDVAYHEDVLLFTRLSSTLEKVDGRTYDVSLSRPHWFDPMTMLSIQDYGLAPTIVIEPPDGERQEIVAAMNIFPPGAEDSIELPELGLVVHMVAFPDYGTVDGRDVSLSYNIIEPRFRLTVSSSLTGDVLARGLVSLDEPLVIGETSISVDELRRHGTYRLNRSYALPLFMLAALMIPGGLVFRLLVRRHDVRAWDTPEGVVVDTLIDIGGRSEGHARLANIQRREADR